VIKILILDFCAISIEMWRLFRKANAAHMASNVWGTSTTLSTLFDRKPTPADRGCRGKPPKLISWNRPLWKPIVMLLHFELAATY